MQQNLLLKNASGVDLSNLRDVVKNDVQTKYDQMIKKVHAIQTIDTSDLVKKTDYNTKINEIERKFLIMIIVTSLLLLKNLIG